MGECGGVSGSCPQFCGDGYCCKLNEAENACEENWGLTDEKHLCVHASGDHLFCFSSLVPDKKVTRYNPPSNKGT